jgi:hypothetical protein
VPNKPMVVVSQNTAGSWHKPGTSRENRLPSASSMAAPAAPISTWSRRADSPLFDQLQPRDGDPIDTTLCALISSKGRLEY